LNHAITAQARGFFLNLLVLGSQTEHQGSAARNERIVVERERTGCVHLATQIAPSTDKNGIGRVDDRTVAKAVE
jgi:hypothetical protein